MAEAALTVEIPRKLVAGARSKVRPAASSERDQDIVQNPLFPIIGTSIRSLKGAVPNTITLLRHLSRVEGSFGATVNHFVEVAYTSYKVRAFSAQTHRFDPDGTRLAMSIISNLDTPTEYDGTTKKKSFDEVIKLALKEALLSGLVSGELVLNKQRLPDSIQLVNGESLLWKDDGEGGAYPAQQVTGETDPVSLDIPTFFYSHLNPDPDTITPRSVMEACIGMLVYFQEFLEDIQKSVRQAGHNRLKFTLDADKVKKMAPREILQDAVKLKAFYESVRDAFQQQLETLNPEDGIVMYDFVEADVLQSGTGSKLDYSPLLNTIIGQYSTAMKTPPSVLGLRLTGGSQQMGSVETLMFLKTAKTLHTPVETFFSRLLTLACRLYGADVYIWFSMDPLDLRPERELEAFNTMKESRLLDRLSLGLITDEEAALELGCFPLPEGYKPLSGTMFRHQNKNYETHPGDTPMGRALQPDKDAPRKAGGRSQ